MRIRFCAVFVLMMGVVSASAQLVASHAPTGAAPKPAPSTMASKGGSAALPPATMAPAMQVSGKAVARVNGVELNDRELVREMFTIFPYAQQHNGFPKQLEPEIRRGALQMIIFDELVYQEAKRRNVSIPAADMVKAEREFKTQFPTRAAYNAFLQSETNGSEQAMRDKIRRALMIESLLNKEITAQARITTAQIKSHYDKNIEQYKHGEVLHIQSISILPPNATKSVQQEAKKRAEDAAKQAKQAKSYRDFGLLAEKLSDDDFHVNMGDHRAQPANTLPPPILQVLAKMKIGDVSDLIDLGGNYTIVRLEARTPAGTTPFSEVKSQLQSDMQKEKTEQLRSAFGQKLRQNAKVETL